MDYNIGNIPLIGYGFIGVTALVLTYATILDTEPSGSKKESYSDTLLNSTPGIPAAEPKSDAEAQEEPDEEEQEQEEEEEQEQKGGKRKKKTRMHKSNTNHKRKQRRTKTKKEKK